MFVNRMPRYEILSEDAMATLDRGWRRIVTELGIEFTAAGGGGGVPRRPARRSTASSSSSTRTSCSSRSRRRRASSTCRRGTRSTRSTSAATTWSSRRCTGRRSCARATCGAMRRWRTSRTSCKLSQTFPQLDSAGRDDLRARGPPLDSRHLDMVLALQTLTDKPYMGSVTSAENAEDTIAMGEILFGGREAIERAPVSISLINVNSPLRYDDRMLGGDARVRPRRPARRDHAVPADGRDVAGLRARGAGAADGGGACRDRAGAARSGPGTPVIFGSFLSNTDMQSGSPSFGTPESAVGLLCTGQIARHFGLPWRERRRAHRQPDRQTPRPPTRR